MRGHEQDFRCIICQRKFHGYKSDIGKKFHEIKCKRGGFIYVEADCYNAELKNGAFSGGKSDGG